MKYFIVSDIHGSLYYTKKIQELIEIEKPDQIILLGDLYYHGPRNPLPIEYNPMEVSKILNSYSNLRWVQGNCDAEVDQMISTFKMEKSIVEVINNKRFYFTHGHIYNIDNIPSNIDALVYGHFHTGFIKKLNNVICVNAGSVTLPKNNTPNSYLIIDDEYIYLKDLNALIIDQIKY